ncbi:HAD family phosphatase [Candidatus Woesearchaeota archaeon]|nr:HAD family phosphatase [Candidatus Woesearchaeota archaeon]
MSGGSGYKAVLFDVGGVLATDVFTVLDRLFADMTGTELAEYKKARRKEWREYEKGLIDGIEFMGRLKKQFKIPLEPEEMMGRSYELIKVDEDTLNLAKELGNRGFKLGVITNNSDEWSQYEKDTLGLGKHFKIWISSSEEHKCKPCEEIYRKAADLLGLEPAECIFIDNRQKNIDGAKAAGMKGVFFKDADSVRQALIKLGLL